MNAPVQTNIVVWSIDGEVFGGCDTLDELIAYHGAGAFEVGQTVYFGDQKPLGTDWVDADDVIDLIGDRAYDQAGEWAEDFPDVSGEAKALLDRFLSEWQAAHCKPTFYSVENVQEHVITREDLARAGGDA